MEDSVERVVDNEMTTMMMRMSTMMIMASTKVSHEDPTSNLVTLMTNRLVVFRYFPNHVVATATLLTTTTTTTTSPMAMMC